MPMSGSGGPISRCRKSCAARWRRSRSEGPRRSPAAGCGISRGAGNRWRSRRARRARRCGAGSRRPRTRCSPGPRRIWPPRTRSDRPTWHASRRCASSAEALADSTDWVKTATEIQQLQARVEDHRPGHTRAREGDLGAIPRRMRSLLHPTPGRSEAAQGRLVDQSHAQGRTLRDRPRRSRIRPSGRPPRRRSSSCRRSGKPSGRCARASPKPCGIVSARACDRFFDRYKHRDQLDLQQKAEPRDEVIRELEALLPPSGTEPVRRRRTSPRLCRRRAAAGSRRRSCRG